MHGLQGSIFLINFLKTPFSNNHNYVKMNKAQWKTVNFQLLVSKLHKRFMHHR